MLQRPETQCLQVHLGGQAQAMAFSSLVVLLLEVSEQMRAPLRGMVCRMGFQLFMFCYVLGLVF